MATPFDYLDEDAPDFDPALIGLPRTLLAQAQPRPGRALPKALGSVTTTAQTAPKPEQAGAPQSAFDQLPGIYASANAMRNQAYDKLTPSDADLDQYRRSGTLGQLAGMAMQMLGNESQQAIGGSVLKQSMAELERGKRDPWKVAELEAKKLEAQATALENQAKFAVTVEEKRAAEKAANDLKQQAIEMRAQIAQSSLEMRGIAAGQAASAREDRRAAADERARQMLFQREHTLRGDYAKATKDITDAQRAAQQLISIVPAEVGSMNAQQQQALIFSFMKMLDPGSVVRESEYVSAAKARGVLDTLSNYTTYLQTGKPLTPTQVANMAALGRQLMDSTGELKRDINTQFETTARGWGVDPRNFVTGGTPERAPPGTPRAVEPFSPTQAPNPGAAAARVPNYYNSQPQ